MNSIWSTDTNCSVFENNIFSKLTLNEGTHMNNSSSVPVVWQYVKDITTGDDRESGQKTCRTYKLQSVCPTTMQFPGFQVHKICFICARFVASHVLNIFKLCKYTWHPWAKLYPALWNNQLVIITLDKGKTLHSPSLHYILFASFYYCTIFFFDLFSLKSAYYKTNDGWLLAHLSYPSSSVHWI